MPKNPTPSNAPRIIDRLTPPTDAVDVEIIGYEYVKVPSTSDIESVAASTLTGRVKLASTDEIESVAESTLTGTLMSADYGQAGESLTYGNPMGRQLLEDRNDLRMAVRRLEDSVMRMRVEARDDKTEMQAEISELQRQVRDLTLSSVGYRKIRHRFLDVYRRDVMQDIDWQGHQNVKDGNEAAHHADAVADAALVHL